MNESPNYYSSDKLVPRGPRSKLIKLIEQARDKEQLHPVISKILDRVKDRSRPGMRQDNNLVGLGSEGGGFRGSVAVAEMAAMEFLGWYVFGYPIRDTFDRVYGSSAGAIHVASLAGFQLMATRLVYSRMLNNRDFVDPLRIFNPFSKKPGVDMSYLFDGILAKGGRLPLNFDEIQRSGLILSVLAACADRNAKPRLNFTEFDSREDLLVILKGGATMPFISGKPVRFRDTLLLDGGLIEAVPYEQPVHMDQLTHYLVFLSEPEVYTLRKIDILERQIGKNFLLKYNPKLVILFLSRYERYAAVRVKLKNKQISKEGAPFISYIAPPGSLRIKRLETRSSVLDNAHNLAAEVTFRAFGIYDSDAISELLKEFNQAVVL